MKYYSYSASLVSRYRKPLRPRAAVLSREQIPATISPLDVLLSIWIAEAVLDSGTRAPRRKKRPRRRSRDL